MSVNCALKFTNHKRKLIDLEKIKLKINMKFM